MSEENLAIIQRGFEYFAATGDQLWDNYADDVVVRDHESPDQAEYVGHDGVRRWLDDWGAAWDEWNIDVEELVDARDDGVLVLVHQTARGHASGMELDSHDGMLFTMRDGKVAALDYYTGRERALAAAGLRSA